ncbi:MAG: hypothetical protein MJ234_01485 [bacterium]|nr:hypothetical protein [bacterium]
MVSAEKMKKVKVIVAKTAEFCGVDVVSVDYVRDYGQNVLRIIIDKDGGVTTDDCAFLSRSLSKKLDETDVIKEQYYLEVSSPGTDDFDEVPELG